MFCCAERRLEAEVVLLAPARGDGEGQDALGTAVAVDEAAGAAAVVVSEVRGVRRRRPVPATPSAVSATPSADAASAAAAGACACIFTRVCGGASASTALAGATIDITACSVFTQADNTHARMSLQNQTAPDIACIAR